MSVRRRPLWSALAALALVLVSAPLGRAGLTNAAPGGFMSENVTWLGNIPVDGLGIGGRPLDLDDDGRVDRFYVTSLQGLSIYDLTLDPALPVLMGHLPLPHWENEDVAVSADGTRVLVSTDDLFGESLGFLAIIDASDPHAPVLVDVLLRASHTVTCIDDACDWVYGSTGEIYDLGALPERVRYSGGEGWLEQARQQAVQDFGMTPQLARRQGAHDLNVDDSGLVTSDTLPRFVMDVSDPLHPDVVAVSQTNKSLNPRIDEDSKGETAYQHNNTRPDASNWSPRTSPVAGDPAAEGGLLPGELLLSNGETNATGYCGSTNGPFATWDMADYDRGRAMRPIEVFRPVSSNHNGFVRGVDRPWVDGDPALNVLGCSGHWFDHLDADDSGEILVAASWYEHGTRILSVDSATGSIEEAGFFQPVTGSAFASHWITDEIVYTVDVVRGIDILRFDRDAPRPSIDDLIESWTANLSARAVEAGEADRLYCKLSIETAVDQPR